MLFRSYSKSSNSERFFLFDVDKQVMLHKSLVAHGKNSGQEYARYFSNIPETKKSSMGFHITAESYYGMHGLSMRMDGVEPRFNGNVRKRDIVMHSADYVSQKFIAEHNRLGRSWGCPTYSAQHTRGTAAITVMTNRVLCFMVQSCAVRPTVPDTRLDPRCP